MALPKAMRLKGHRTFDYIHKNSVKYYGKLMTKRTLGGTSRKRKRVSGFRVRMRSHTGRRVIKSRRKRGRERIAV